MEQWGLKIAWVDFFKSILAALAVCAFVFLVTLVENKLFKINFNCFLWGLKNIPAANLVVFFKYLPFYLVFGIAVSVAINSAYYNKIGNEPEWANELFFAIMNLIPSLAITLIGFGIYAKTGVKPFIFGSTYTFTYTYTCEPRSGSLRPLDPVAVLHPRLEDAPTLIAARAVGMLVVEHELPPRAVSYWA